MVGDIWAFGGCDHKYMYGDVHCLHLEVELNSLAKDIRNLFNSERFSDITFVIQGRHLPAHRIILWARGYITYVVGIDFVQKKLQATIAIGVGQRK